MFDNIGGKIQTLAVVVCWIGIIACIITGIVLMATDEDLVLTGILTAVVGSLLSWVGSFVLYGFGQLVENSDIIAEQSARNNEKTPLSNSSNTKTPFSHLESQHKWRCSSCGEMISSNPCPYCGNNSQYHKESTAPYLCGKCGKEGPYEGNCPNCGSSLKNYNVQI